MKGAVARRARSPLGAALPQATSFRKGNIMRIKLAVAVLAASILALGGVTLASANSNGASDNNGAHAMKLFALTVQIDFIDLGAKGFSLGDEQVFSDDLLDTKGGTKLGVDGGVCTVVRVTDVKLGSGSAQCAVTLSLANGQIAVQGLVTFVGNETPPPFDLAITGGTGAFKEARGTVTVEETSETEANLTVNVVTGADD